MTVLKDKGYTWREPENKSKNRTTEGPLSVACGSEGVTGDDGGDGGGFISFPNMFVFKWLHLVFVTKVWSVQLSVDGFRGWTLLSVLLYQNLLYTCLSIFYLSTDVRCCHQMSDVVGRFTCFPFCFISRQQLKKHHSKLQDQNWEMVNKWSDLQSLI